MLPEVGCSVYLDANILVLGDLTPLIREFVNSGADIGLFPHRERSTLAEEFEFCRRVGHPPSDVEKGLAQLRRYREAGLPPRPLVHRERYPLPPPRQPGPRRGNRSLVGGAQGLYPARPAEPALRVVPHQAPDEDLGLELQVPKPLFVRYPHRQGPLGDLNVFLKNKRHYGRLQHALCGTALFLAHGGRRYQPHELG